MYSPKGTTKEPMGESCWVLGFPSVRELPPPRLGPHHLGRRKPSSGAGLRHVARR